MECSKKDCIMDKVISSLRNHSIKEASVKAGKKELDWKNFIIKLSTKDSISITNSMVKDSSKPLNTTIKDYSNAVNLMVMDSKGQNNTSI